MGMYQIGTYPFLNVDYFYRKHKFIRNKLKAIAKNVILW